MKAAVISIYRNINMSILSSAFVYLFDLRSGDGLPECWKDKDQIYSIRFGYQSMAILLHQIVYIKHFSSKKMNFRSNVY